MPCFTPISHTAGGSSSCSASVVVRTSFAYLQRVPAWKDSAAVRAASEKTEPTHVAVGRRSALAHWRSQDGRAAAKKPAWRPQIQPAISPRAVLDRLRQVETPTRSPTTSVRRQRLFLGGEQREQGCKSQENSPRGDVLVKQRTRREHERMCRATCSAADPAVWACGRQLRGAPSPAHCSGYKPSKANHGSFLDSREQGGSRAITDEAVEATGAPSASC